MNTHHYKAYALAALVLLLSGCRTPAPFTGTLDQSKPRPLSEKLRLPERSQPMFVVAGLDQEAIPQGMALLPDSNRILTSHYFDQTHPSCLVATDRTTGRSVSTLQLLEPDGSPHRGHVGGLAAAGTNLWIASDKFLYRADPAPCHDTQPSGSLQTLEKIKTEATEEVAFCSVFDGLIWAGEFAMGSKFPTHPSHHLMARDGEKRSGWLCGYDSANGFELPEKIISLPDRTQGAVATDSYIFLSRSYGRRNRSTLGIYANPLKEKAHLQVKTSTGKAVPLWFLDSRNLVRILDLPPMSENIVIHHEHLYIIFESGARKFRFFGKEPIDYVIRLEMKELLE